MCTVLLPPGVNLIAVKYISHHIISYHIYYISNHIIPYIISNHISYYIMYHIFLYSPLGFRAPFCGTTQSLCQAQNSNPDWQPSVLAYTYLARKVKTAGRQANRIACAQWHWLEWINIRKGKQLQSAILNMETTGRISLSGTSGNIIWGGQVRANGGEREKRRTGTVNCVNIAVHGQWRTVKCTLQQQLYLHNVNEPKLYKRT
jgi:hypothetical protein